MPPRGRQAQGQRGDCGKPAKLADNGRAAGEGVLSACHGHGESSENKRVPCGVSNNAGPDRLRSVGDDTDEQNHADEHHGEGRQPGEGAVPTEQDGRYMKQPPHDSL